MTEGLGNKWQWVGKGHGDRRQTQQLQGGPNPQSSTHSSGMQEQPRNSNLTGLRSHPGLSKGQQHVVKQCHFPHRFLLLLARGYSAGPREGLKLPKLILPSPPCLQEGCSTNHGSCSVLPTCQEQCFACTKVWHSKLLLKPSSPG